MQKDFEKDPIASKLLNPDLTEGESYKVAVEYIDHLMQTNPQVKEAYDKSLNGVGTWLLEYASQAPTPAQCSQPGGDMSPIE